MDSHIQTITNMIHRMQGDPSYGVLASLWLDRHGDEQILLEALDDLIEMGCLEVYESSGDNFYRLT